MAKFIDSRCDFGFKFCTSDPIIMKFFPNAILKGRMENINPSIYERAEEGLLGLIGQAKSVAFSDDEMDMEEHVL